MSRKVVIYPNFDAVACHHQQMAFHRESSDTYMVETSQTTKWPEAGGMEGSREE